MYYSSYWNVKYTSLELFILISVIFNLCSLPFCLSCPPFAPKQEVLLHHSAKGPRVPLPQRVEARAARGHVENVTAHVRWTDPDPRRAALLLRGLRLVGVHSAAVHGLSVQPGQQPAGIISPAVRSGLCRCAHFKQYFWKYIRLQCHTLFSIMNLKNAFFFPGAHKNSFWT